MTISNIIFKHTQAKSQTLAYENISSRFYGDVSTLAKTLEIRSGKKPKPSLPLGTRALALGWVYSLLFYPSYCCIRSGTEIFRFAEMLSLIARVEWS